MEEPEEVSSVCQLSLLPAECCLQQLDVRRFANLVTSLSFNSWQQTVLLTTKNKLQGYLFGKMWSQMCLSHSHNQRLASFNEATIATVSCENVIEEREGGLTGKQSVYIPIM